MIASLKLSIPYFFYGWWMNEKTPRFSIRDGSAILLCWSFSDGLVGLYLKLDPRVLGSSEVAVLGYFPFFYGFGEGERWCVLVF